MLQWQVAVMGDDFLVVAVADEVVEVQDAVLVKGEVAPEV
jgi:hypothetical protein